VYILSDKIAPLDDDWVESKHVENIVNTEVFKLTLCRGWHVVFINIQSRAFSVLILKKKGFFLKFKYVCNIPILDAFLFTLSLRDNITSLF